MSDLVSELRDIIKPENVGDERAREGSRALYENLSDDALMKLAGDIAVRRVGVKPLLADLSHLVDNETSMIWALQRFRLKVFPLRDRIKKYNLAERLPTKREKLPSDALVFSPEVDVLEVLESCKVPFADSSSLDTMSFCLEVQKKIVVRQLREIAKSPTAFLASKELRAGLRTCFDMAKDIVSYQMSLGLIRKVPKRIDVRINQAFQSHLGELGGAEEVNKMAKFAKDLADVIEGDYVEVSQ